MEGSASLGINGATLLAQLVNFIILFVLLYLVAYKPIMRMLDQRSDKIKGSMEQTEQIKQQAEHAEEETRKLLETAAQDGQEVVARAVRTGEEMRQQSQEDARKDAENLITRAQAEIQRERDEAIDGLRSEFADLTVLAASKVIGRALDKEKHSELIDKTLEESESLKKG